MKEYITRLIIMAIVCGIFELLAPDGDGGGWQKYIRLTASLIVLSLAISPIIPMIKEISEGDSSYFEKIDDLFDMDEEKQKYEEICKDSILNMTSESLAERCEILLCSDLGMPSGGFRVDIFLADEEVSLARLTIYPEAMAENPHQAAKYISELLKCECEIIYDKKV